MDFPRKVLTINSATSKRNPNVVVPANTVFEVTSRVGDTHLYWAKLGDDDTFILHITMFKFLKDETDCSLYRRAVARKGISVDEEYYTTAYNSPIAWQLRRRDEELQFCMTSEDALNKAVEWEGYLNSGDKPFSRWVCNDMINNYTRYAEILEKFERVIDENCVDQFKENQKELKNAH